MPSPSSPSWPRSSLRWCRCSAFTTTAARACACGCSVFDVGGGLLPQENDHGGRIFVEYWHSDQNTNWIGNAKGSAALNQDKNLTTELVQCRLQLHVQSRMGHHGARALGQSQLHHHCRSDDRRAERLTTPGIGGDIEIMGMYTGFFKDMSTGVTFGLKLPTGIYTAYGFDRDTQIGSRQHRPHSRRVPSRHDFRRQCLAVFLARCSGSMPFLYRASPTIPDAGTWTLYKPGFQADGAIGILYNNCTMSSASTRSRRSRQVIASHRAHDSGPAADPLNSGFDRLMFSPGIEFTKVLDEANNRVFKFYVDVEVPFYYRTNAADNGGPPSAGGTEGQLIAPVLYKAIASYNF